MKKILVVVMLFAACLFSSAVFAAEAIPSAPSGVYEMEAAAKRVADKVDNLNWKLTSKNGVITALTGSVQAMGETTKSLAASTEKLATATEKSVDAIKNVGTAVTNEATATRTMLGRNTFILFLSIFFGTIVLVFSLWILFNRSRTQTAGEVTRIITAVNEARDRVIAEVPDETDRRVKTLPLFEPFMLDGKTITFVPKIVNGAYQSLYINDEDIMMRFSTPGKLHSSMSSLLKKYLDPAKRQQMSPKQVALIELAINDGSLKIA